MLKPKKRLTKRQLKEDKLVTYYFKVTDYIHENRRTLGTAIGVAALVIVGLVVFISNTRQKESEAAVQFAQARVKYAEQDYQAAIDLLRNLVDNYGGTDKARLGQFYLANAYYEQGNYEAAEKYYRAFLDDGGDKLLESSALAGVAACLEQKGAYAEAADYYQQAAEKYDDVVLAPHHLYDAARCYELAGNQTAAQKVLRRILEEYPDSGIKNEAELLLAEVTF